MKLGILVMVVLLVSGCATTRQVKEMSAAEEARYAAAIEEAEVKSPSPLEEGDVIVVTTGETAEEALSRLQPEVPAVSRRFKVPRAEYDAFFSQSPAVVLARMQLEPITDGGTLLGYRVLKLKRFAGVDLQDGDIIVGIDGVMPRTPDAYFERWEKAKTGSGCVVNVQRDLERFELVWEAE